MTDDELVAKKLAFIETCVRELAHPERGYQDVDKNVVRDVVEKGLDDFTACLYCGRRLPIEGDQSRAGRFRVPLSVGCVFWPTLFSSRQCAESGSLRSKVRRRGKEKDPAIPKAFAGYLPQLRDYASALAAEGKRVLGVWLNWIRRGEVTVAGASRFVSVQASTAVEAHAEW